MPSTRTSAAGRQPKWGTGTASASPGREGIVVLEDSAGYLFGLFSYADGLGLLHGPTLRVNNLVIPHFVACGEATGLMECAMQDIARRLDCRAIHVRLARSLGNAPKSGLARLLESSGYRAEGPTWCRVLPTTATNRP